MARHDSEFDPASKYPLAFLMSVRQTLEDGGMTVNEWLPEAVAVSHADGAKSTIGLENLFRKIHGSPPDDWPDRIREFLDRLDQPLRGQAYDTDLETAGDRLLVRLRPDFAGEPLADLVWWQALGSSGLIVALVLDHADALSYVTREMVEKSGRSGEEWLERAVINLRERTPEDFLDRILPAENLWMGHTNDSYDAGRALLLDELLPDHADAGCFVGVPTRDCIFVLPVQPEAVPRLHVFKGLTAQTFQTKPYPISDDVYWVRGGVWYRVFVELADNTLKLGFPDELADLLEWMRTDDDDVNEEDE